MAVSITNHKHLAVGSAPGGSLFTLALDVSMGETSGIVKTFKLYRSLDKGATWQYLLDVSSFTSGSASTVDHDNGHMYFHNSLMYLTFANGASNMSATKIVYCTFTEADPVGTFINKGITTSTAYFCSAPRILVYGNEIYISHQYHTASTGSAPGVGLWYSPDGGTTSSLIGVDSSTTSARKRPTFIRLPNGEVLFAYYYSPSTYTIRIRKIVVGTGTVSNVLSLSTGGSSNYQTDPEIIHGPNGEIWLFIVHNLNSTDRRLSLYKSFDGGATYVDQGRDIFSDNFVIGHRYSVDSNGNIYALIMSKGAASSPYNMQTNLYKYITGTSTWQKLHDFQQSPTVDMIGMLKNPTAVLSSLITSSALVGWNDESNDDATYDVHSLNYKNIKVWNGSAWVGNVVEVETWNGTEWKARTIRREDSGGTFINVT